MTAIFNLFSSNYNLVTLRDQQGILKKAMTTSLVADLGLVLGKLMLRK